MIVLNLFWKLKSEIFGGEVYIFSCYDKLNFIMELVDCVVLIDYDVLCECISRLKFV